MHYENQLHYCQHFQHFKSSKKFVINDKDCCKFCLNSTTSLWLCLHVHKIQVRKTAEQQYVAGQTICTQAHIYNNKRRVKVSTQFSQTSVQDQSDVNIATSKSTTSNNCQQTNQQSNNPLKFRLAVLPFLAQLAIPKSKDLSIQLWDSWNCRKDIERLIKDLLESSLIGLFLLNQRYNYSLISAIQFITHCDFFKDVLLSIKLPEVSNNKKIVILKQLKILVNSIQQANQRAIRVDTLFELMINTYPHMLGYSRRDPFEHVLQFLNIIHEHLNFYKVTDVIQNFGKDQWDLFHTNNIESHCAIYDSLTSILCLDYKCKSCENQQQYNHSINFIKLDIPKKRRKNKVIENELNEKGYQSPRKRGKSLISFILPQQQLPITIPQLLIDFLKQYLHKQKFCPKFKNKQTPMKATKIRFKKLPELLILQINRISKNTDIVDQTEILMNYDPVNLAPFSKVKSSIQQESKSLNKDQQSDFYQFCSMIGMEKGIFPVVCRSRSNNQLYNLRNQVVEMLLKNKANPYVICLKRKSPTRAQQFYQQVMMQNECLKETNSHLRKQMISLPDFYHIQLQHGIELPVYQPISCKHNKIKPQIDRKCTEQINITYPMYQHLIQTYKGTILYNQMCSQCQQDIQNINLRKIKQKQLIKDYDKYKTNINVMISMSWLKKWSNYLYLQDKNSYFHKGYPFPPPIDNRTLIQNNNKCKKDIVKNKDFKIISIFIFKLLKALYGGGPEIMYKWPHQPTTKDKQLIQQIKIKAQQLKTIYNQNEPQSLRSTIVLEKSSSFMDTVNQSQMEDLQITQDNSQK